MKLRTQLYTTLAVSLIGVCSSVNASIDISPVAETTPSIDSANSIAVWQNKENVELSRLYGSAETGGIEIYDITGNRLQTVSAGTIENVSLFPTFGAGESDFPLLIATDVASSTLRTFKVDHVNGNLTELPGKGLQLPQGAEIVCAHYSPVEGKAYAFVVDEYGNIEQRLLSEMADGSIKSQTVRHLQLASEVKACLSDTVTDSVYFSEEAVGIWRFNAAREAEPIPTLIDARKFGQISEEVAGLAIYRGDRGEAFLIASNATDSTLNVYNMHDDHNYIGQFNIAGGAEVDGVQEAGGLLALPTITSKVYPEGLFIAADDDNGTEATNYKLVSWEDVSKALQLSQFGGQMTTSPEVSFVSVEANAQTVDVDSAGDAADDPAIWVHPTDSSKSLIIGTDKRAGLGVYDLTGGRIQFLPVGKINNVDIRYDFKLGNEHVALVTASNRTDQSISVFKVNSDTRELTDVADGQLATGFADPYGQCMYQSAKSKKTYVFVNDSEGAVRQWELLDAGNGKVTTALVREFSLKTVSEGCVADDETGNFFIAEEDLGIWKFGAEPQDGASGQLIASVQTHPELAADVEGLSIYYGIDGAGYLIASSQGNDSYAVFERGGEHKYTGSFRVISNDALGIDGASETDGLDVISTPLGDQFPYGVFVAQDGRRPGSDAKQNFKLVAWENIADKLGLIKEKNWKPW